MRLIDADETIEYLYEHLQKLEECCQNTDDKSWEDRFMIAITVIRTCMYYIKNAPTADKWILCSEKMPKEDKEVFVYLFGDDPYIAWVNHNGKWETEHFECDEDEEPIAWFLLPKPYKEKQDA